MQKKLKVFLLHCTFWSSSIVSPWNTHFNNLKKLQWSSALCESPFNGVTYHPPRTKLITLKWGTGLGRREQFNAIRCQMPNVKCNRERQGKLKRKAGREALRRKHLLIGNHTCNSVTPTLPEHLSSALLSSSSQYLWRNTCICTSAIHKDHPSQFLTKELFQAGREDATLGEEFTRRACCPSDGHRLSLH